MGSLPDYEIALADHTRRSASGELALTPRWEQCAEGAVRGYRTDIYARGIASSYPIRRGSLFDMAYAASPSCTGIARAGTLCP